MSSATDFSTLGRLGTTGDGPPRKRPASRRRQSARRPGRRAGRGIASALRLQVLVAVVVAVVAVLFVIGLAVGSQTGSLPTVSLATPHLDPSLEVALRTGGARTLSTGTLTLTPGGGAAEGAITAPPAFAAVEDVAIFLPFASAQDIIFMEADNAAALPLVPVGTLERNANPEGFEMGEAFDGPPFTVATPRSGVRPATGMAALLTTPGMTVLSPVQGVVNEVVEYTTEDGTPDWKVTLTPEGRLDLEVVLRHIARPSVVPGQAVTAGQTSIGEVRDGAVVSSELNPLALPSVLVHVRPATQGTVADAS